MKLLIISERFDGRSKRDRIMAKALPPMHPGEVLREEFLVPMTLSPYALAKICDLAILSPGFRAVVISKSPVQ